MGKRYGCSGFTLVELMVVMVILAVLQTLVAPAFSAMVNSVRLTTAVNSLFSSLILARSEAIMRNSRVVVCKSTTGYACIMTGGWEQGWIVFHDVNNNAARDVGESLLWREQALPNLIRLTGNGPVVSYISYTSQGTTSYTSGAFQAGTLTVCAQSATPADARQIVISSAGRPRTAKTTVDQCSI